jgi:hypothetical protein
MVHSRVGGRCLIFPVDALRQIREDLFAREWLYHNAAGNYRVPPGWARLHDARQMFGVSRATWDQWACQGLVPPGERFDGGPTLYRIEDVKRCLGQAGLLPPPYPDPDRPGAYRVRLCGSTGRDPGGREAVIDAESLLLLDGATLAWERIADGQSMFVGICRPDAPQGVALRRVVMGVTDADLNVGHINGDPLDCRRVNLAVRTIAQRSHRTRKMRAIKGRPCSSQFKGVTWDRWTNKWRAKIVADGKPRSLGRFGDELAAAQAYDEAARELFGEHARLNFPDGVDAFLDAQSTNNTAPLPPSDASHPRAAA